MLRLTARFPAVRILLALLGAVAWSPHSLAGLDPLRDFEPGTVDAGQNPSGSADWVYAGVERTALSSSEPYTLTLHYAGGGQLEIPLTLMHYEAVDASRGPAPVFYRRHRETGRIVPFQITPEQSAALRGASGSAADVLSTIPPRFDPRLVPGLIEELRARQGLFVAQSLVEIASLNNGTCAGGATAPARAALRAATPARRGIAVALSWALHASYPAEVRALVFEGRYMEAAWVLEEAGNARAASAIRGTLADRLGSTAVRSDRVLGGGVTETRLITLEDGTVAVFKPESTEIIADVGAEIAAYRADRLFGINRVPVTVQRTIGGRRGSLQYFVSEAPSGEALGTEVVGGDLRFFDYIIGNGDRHWNNFLVGNRGRRIAIDHGAAFPPPGDARLFWRRMALNTGNVGEFIPNRALFDRVRSISRDQIRRELSPFLSADRVQGVIERRDALLGMIDQEVAARGVSAVFH